MKKNILLFSTVLFPLLISHAQVGTGGLEQPSKESFQAVAEQMELLESHLVKRDAICSAQDRLLKENDLMQAYLKLSLFKKPKSASDTCEEANKYFACMNDDSTKYLVKEFNKNPKATFFLMTRYKINEPEAKLVMNFFADLGKKAK